MIYSDLIYTLLDKIPELLGKYDEEKDYIENLPHLVFEIVFVPYFKEIMAGESKQVKENAIELLEQMITCEDEKVQEVAVVSVLESLLPERDFLMKIRDQLGVKTQKSLQILEREFGWNSYG